MLLIEAAHVLNGHLQLVVQATSKSKNQQQLCHTNLRAVEGVCCHIEPLQSFVVAQGCCAVLVQQAGEGSIRLDGLGEEVRLRCAAWHKGIWVPPISDSLHV